ncbi:FHA domain-containing protein [Hydrogenophaga sp. PAMC20947]|uniref:FHA domain-containing protein n=1 Tax=Hydrogenophaga sp. PAMC20947 TaxID=2565558 RepID=UPI00109E2519|nr:FHA domain-containing protein [Hydrogenophaga sp. PAMC20947]QCB45613.1 FHA domain-containing protein [Hydrogenophaga sp. PAMC20947]
MSWAVEHLHRDGRVLARIRTEGDRFTLGRALDNDLVLDDPHAAPHHAELVFHGPQTASLSDLGTLNGIALQRGKKVSDIYVERDQTLRVGSSWIRVRSSAWPLAPELPMEKRLVWVWALLALIAVLVHSSWKLWLTDLQTESPPYLYVLAGIAGFIGLWSAAYALYGRLVNGADRFFNHLLIACSGYLGVAVLEDLLSTLGFSSGWVWPAQWQPYLVGLCLAFIVRAHLRTADPGHWPAARWGLAVVTVAAMTVPLAQRWITHHELTATHTMDQLSYPALRWASPQPLDTFLNDVNRLQSDADAARDESPGAESESAGDEDVE